MEDKVRLFQEHRYKGSRKYLRKQLDSDCPVEEGEEVKGSINVSYDPD
jgi:hypothetical protein